MKRAALAGLVAAGALLMATWATPLVRVRGDLGQAGPVDLTATGEVAAAALMPFGGATLALALALLIAGPVFRRILGVLAAALGAAALWQALAPAIDPVRAAAGSIRGATGLGDLAAIRAAVPDGATAVQPGIALGIAGAVLALAASALVLRGGPSWAGAGRRFEAQADARARTASPADRHVAQWDALSHGDDPTDGAAVDMTLAPGDGHASSGAVAGRDSDEPGAGRESAAGDAAERRR